LSDTESYQPTHWAPLDAVTPSPAADVQGPLATLRTSTWAIASFVLALTGASLLAMMIIWWTLLSHGIYFVTGEQLGFSADYNFFPAILGVYGVSFGLALAGVICGHVARWRLKHVRGAMLGKRQMMAGLTLGYLTAIVEFGVPLLLYLAIIMMCPQNCS